MTKTVQRLSWHAALAVSAMALLGCDKPSEQAEPIRAVRSIVIQATASQPEREYAAEIKARTEARLSFRVAGKLIKRLVEPGQPVRAGQTLALLDAQDMTLSSAGANAGLMAAKVNMDQAAADHKRFGELRDQGFISAAEFERKDSTLRAARAQYEQLQAQAALMGNQAGYTKLVADVAGTVTAVDAEPGMVVAAGAPVIRLAHDGPRDAVFSLPEDQVGLLQRGGEAVGTFSVRGWAETAALHPASLRELSAAADPVTRTYQVKLQLGQAAALKLGQTATVSWKLPSRNGVIKLPLSALREEQGKTMVWLVDEKAMTVQSAAVQVAGAAGNEAVVVAGLRPGDRVVTAGVHVLAPGQKIRLYAELPSSSPIGYGSSTPVTPK